jgi:hypothetical protein
MNAKPHLVMFFYNSAEDIINLQIATSGNDDCIITLTDASEKIVKVFGLNLVEGVNKVALEEMRSLSKGYYMINVRTTSQVYLFSAKICK